MMPYFVRLPNGKYGQFDVATSKFVNIDMSAEDVRQRAGEFAAALGLSFDCEKIAGDVANGAIVDEKHKDGPYSDQAKYGVRRYVGCMYAIKRRYGSGAAGLAWAPTKGDALMSVFPPSFWQDEPSRVCVGYVVKMPRAQYPGEWLYLSVSKNGVAWYPSQKEAGRFTRIKAHEIVRLAKETDMVCGDEWTYKIGRLMRRVS